MVSEMIDFFASCSVYQPLIRGDLKTQLFEELQSALNVTSEESFRCLILKSPPQLKLLKVGLNQICTNFMQGHEESLLRGKEVRKCHY